MSLVYYPVHSDTECILLMAEGHLVLFIDKEDLEKVFNPSKVKEVEVNPLSPREVDMTTLRKDFPLISVCVAIEGKVLYFLQWETFIKLEGDKLKTGKN